MVYKKLADIKFADRLFEAKAQTQTGQNLLNKYQAYVMANSITCNLINSFMHEAKACLYDGGVNHVYESLADIISTNKYGWAIASTCESINANHSKGNYLALKAVGQVEPLLEMTEGDIVAYIKSGAFKSVMHIDAFRNIAHSIYRNQPVVETYADFNIYHPISIVESKDDVLYFEVLGKIYKIAEGKIETALSSEVSREFIQVSQLLESDHIEFENETLKMKAVNSVYEVKEQGKCTRTNKDQVLELTVDQLREQNNIALTTVPNTLKNQTAALLETFAKIVENFDNIAILNNVNIVTTRNDKFFVIEHEGMMLAESVASNHSTAWNINSNSAEVLKVIKKTTKVDLNEAFSESLKKAIAHVSESEAAAIQESLENDKMDERRRKIAELTERFKDDPVRLQMLSQIAADLNSL